MEYERTDGRVCPAVIHDQLAAALCEGAEVGVGCVERFARLLACGGEAGDRIEGAEIPLGVAIDHVGEVAAAEAGHGGLAALVARDPRRPAVGIELAACGHDGRDGGVANPALGEKSGEGLDLRGAETLLAVVPICR